MGKTHAAVMRQFQRQGVDLKMDILDDTIL